MDASERLKEDLRTGRIDADRLVDLFGTLQGALRDAEQRILTLEQRINTLTQQNADLRRQLADAGGPARIDEPFSMRAEEKRQEARGKKPRPRKPKGRRGRLRTADKIAQAERTETVHPEGVPPSDCHLSHTRPIWRLENGRAVLVAYQVYRGPNDCYGKIPGVLGRSEFGLEIVVAIAFQVQVVGLSFDKVCLLFQFFQNLKLRKSQVDALLHQLSRHWHRQFDVLCTLAANSVVVHADETSWSLSSVWAFLSEKARLLLFGVPKDADTLKKLLDPATFEGIVISDNAAVYGQFTRAQKCWAHLLRKAVKLTLQDSENVTYRRFADRLVAIYGDARRLQGEKGISAEEKNHKVSLLEDAIVKLCGGMWYADLPPLEGLQDDYRLLNNEIMNLLLAEELFTFVTAKATKQPNGKTRPIESTNNEAERALRNPALARKTGRTNKTLRGARRQTVVTSVLESLRLYLGSYTLSSVIEEVQGWAAAGRSCFEKLLESLGLRPPDQSILDRTHPLPSG